ncbi:MAG: hypothetical protein R3301_06920 [Saprospiraceae bacterium]|nr:hypothetical protein [Saprospiraceae bacterium]
MRPNPVLILPVVFAIAGSVVLIAAGDEVEIASQRDTFILRQWHFIAFGILFNAALVILYRWLLQAEISRTFFTLHLVTTFLGMAIFLYMMLPLNDGQDLDAMLRGVTWLLVSAFLVLTGFLMLLVLVAQRLRRPPSSEDDEQSP